MSARTNSHRFNKPPFRLPVPSGMGNPSAHSALRDIHLLLSEPGFTSSQASLWTKGLLDPDLRHAYDLLKNIKERVDAFRTAYKDAYERAKK